MNFLPFDKLARLSRECVVTEKIDGTNSQIYIEDKALVEVTIPPAIAMLDNLVMFAGSRTRWITPLDDNFGFAAWVAKNCDELFKLGPGQHFGEWWGQGIQRNYGLTEKRFSLFNTTRWKAPYDAMIAGHDVKAFPKCCHVTPELYRGIFDTAAIDATLEALAKNGSVAAPGFPTPEGVVVFHSQSNQLYKKTLDKNDQHKWQTDEVVLK